MLLRSFTLDFNSKDEYYVTSNIYKTQIIVRLLKSGTKVKKKYLTLRNQNEEEVNEVMVWGDLGTWGGGGARPAGRGPPPQLKG